MRRIQSIPLILPTESNPAKYGHAGRTRLVNCYATAEGEATKSNAQLHTVYGLANYVNVSAGQRVRGLFSLDRNTLLAVVGRFLYRIDSAGTVTAIGGIPTDGAVQMVGNGRLDAPQVMIVTNGRAYVYQAGVLTEVGDPDYSAALGVIVSNGYGVLVGAQGRWQISGLNDFTSYDPLEFARAGWLPDDLVGAINLEGGIALFGERSTEFWQETGAEDFPFARSTVREFGCAAGASVARVGRAAMFIAHDRTVRVLGGYEAEKVSNPGVDRWLDSADLTSVEAFSWEAEGHTFYALSVGGANDRTDGMSNTFVFDTETGKWHERDSYGYTRWRATCYALHNGRHIIGDDTGKLYIMSGDSHDEAGQPLIVDIQPAPSNTFPARGIAHRAYLDVVPGVGSDTSATVSNPTINLGWSDDGGRNFGNGSERALGGEGEYRTRVQWHRLGMIRSTGRIFRFRSSAAVTRAVLAASMDVEKLAA